MTRQSAFMHHIRHILSGSCIRMGLSTTQNHVDAGARQMKASIPISTSPLASTQTSIVITYISRTSIFSIAGVPPVRSIICSPPRLFFQRVKRALKGCLIFKQRHTPAVLVVVGHSNVSDLSCSILARTAPLSINMRPLTNMLHRNITLTSKVPYLMRAKVVSLRGTCTTATSSLLGVPSRPQAPCARTFKRMRPFSTTSSKSSGGEETSPPAVPETPLYSSHIPTSGFQKLYIAGFSAATAFRDPERGDMVAALGETTGTRALQRLRRAMSADPVGRELLAAKPDIKEDSTRPDRLRRLPEGTFGREYARFLDHHGYSPDERAAVRFVDDAELAFVMQRYRQVHDFWHVLCGLPPTVLGELALKWFEMVQTRLPIAAFSGVVGPLSLSAQERKLLKEQYIPWAVRAAVKARPLMCVWYERSFEEPLELMRKRLQIVTAPPMTTV